MAPGKTAPGGSAEGCASGAHRSRWLLVAGACALAVACGAVFLARVQGQPRRGRRFWVFTPSPFPPPHPPPPVPCPPPPYPRAEAPATLDNGDASIAFCIVGELRTFGIPAVHLGFRDVVEAWRAHAYLAFHTRFDPDNLCMPAKQTVNCEVNDTAIGLLRPKSVRYLYFPECAKSPGAGYSQFYGTDLCFRDAERYAQAHSFRYRVFVRVRPDLAFLEVPPVPAIAHGDNRTYAHMRHGDFAFYMSRLGLEWFRRHGTRLVARGGGCHGLNYMDVNHPSLGRLKRPWRTTSGVVRGPQHLVMVDASTPRAKQAVAERLAYINAPGHEWMWTCNITGRSRHRCRSKEKRRASHVPGTLSLWRWDLQYYLQGLPRPPERHIDSPPPRKKPRRHNRTGVANSSALQPAGTHA